MKILAYNKLRKSGHKVSERYVLGVIIEVPQEKGLDTLACYKDGTARYINQAEKLIVWETNNKDMDSLVKELFDNASVIYNNIGPWEKDRLPPPTGDIVRITLLASDGLYFGQGPYEMFFNDKLAGPTLFSATKILKYLIEKAS